jgi:hypothetical protein
MSVKDRYTAAIIRQYQTRTIRKESAFQVATGLTAVFGFDRTKINSIFVREHTSTSLPVPELDIAVGTSGTYDRGVGWVRNDNRALHLMSL